MEGDSRRDVRAALAVSVLAGLVYVVAVPLFQPDQVAVATDVYYHAATAALAGENPYVVTPPAHPSFRYLYPPVVLLAVVPHALTGSPLGAYVLQTALNVATAAALAVLLLRAIRAGGVALSRRDRWLVAAVALASAHTTSVLLMGQVNLQLALAVALGGVWTERGRQTRAGVAFALAATVKLFPALVGAWLLRRRAWRAVAAATATGLGLLALGVAAFGPERLRYFLTEVVPAERHAAEFAGGLPPSAMYVTLRRPIAAAFPGLDPGHQSLLAVAIIAPVVLASLRSVATYRARLVALLAVLLGTLAYLPLEPFYFSLVYYPLVPLLYLLDPGRVRRLFAAGTALLSVLVSYHSVSLAVAAAPLSPGTAAAIDGLARTVLTAVQPPLAGIALLLAGCVLFQHQRARAVAEASAAGTAEDVAGE